MRPLAVIRRELANPRGAALVAGRVAADGLALRRLIHANSVALVHSNTSVVLGGAAAAAIARIPHVWHVREIYSRFGRLWPAHRRLLGTAAALPCVSHATASQFGPAIRADLARVQVVYDGLAATVARAPRQAARSALDLPDDPPVIAVLGRLSDWKGQDVLVRALALRPLSDVGAIGLVAGEPWPGAERRGDRIKELAEQLGVRDRVRFVGFREDLANVYGAADLVAVPSTEPDPLPGAAIEAAAAGCAVIASASGGLIEILRDRETGRLVAPGDPDALARAARELIDDADARARLGAAAAADATSRFSAQRLLDEIQALYDAVLDR